MDPEGDAPQPLSSRAVLEPSRPRLFRARGATARRSKRTSGSAAPTTAIWRFSRPATRSSATQRRPRARPRRCCNGRRTSPSNASSRRSTISTRAIASTSAPRSPRRNCRHDLKTAAKEGPSRTFGYIRYPAAVRCKADLERHRSHCRGLQHNRHAVMKLPRRSSEAMCVASSNAFSQRQTGGGLAIIPRGWGGG